MGWSDCFEPVGLSVKSCGSGHCTPIPGQPGSAPRRLSITLHDPQRRHHIRPRYQHDHPIRVRPVDPVVRSPPHTVSEASAPACRARRAPITVNLRRQRALPFHLVNFLAVQQRYDANARTDDGQREDTGVTGREVTQDGRLGRSAAARPPPVARFDSQPRRQVRPPLPRCPSGLPGGMQPGAWCMGC
jgi:hypothetical protein